MERQDEFLFADGAAPELHTPHPLADFYVEVASLWNMPLGQPVHIALKSHQHFELRGLLELSRAPNLPLDRAQPLELRIGAVEFTSRQVVGWSLA